MPEDKDYTGRKAKARAMERYAKPRVEELGDPTRDHDERQMPFARHVGVHIIVGEGTASATDSTGAKDNAIDRWEEWRKDPDNARKRIFEMRFEFIEEDKMVIYIIYSD